MIETSVVSVAKRVRQLAGVDPAQPIHAQKGDLEAFMLLQVLEGVQDRVMFRAATDEMTTALPPVSRQAEHGEIVRLGPAAREDQLMRFRAQEVREPVARVIHRCARFAPGRVDAGRVSEMLPQIGQHRLARRRQSGVVAL